MAQTKRPWPCPYLKFSSPIVVVKAGIVAAFGHILELVAMLATRSPQLRYSPSRTPDLNDIEPVTDTLHPPRHRPDRGPRAALPVFGSENQCLRSSSMTTPARLRLWFAQAFAAGPPPVPNLGIVMGSEFPSLMGKLVCSVMEYRVRVLARRVRHPLTMQANRKGFPK